MVGNSMFDQVAIMKWILLKKKEKKRKEAFSAVVCSGKRLHSTVMEYLLDTERSKLQGCLNRLFLNHSSKKERHLHVGN